MILPTYLYTTGYFFMTMQPSIKPNNPYFSSGPCSKRPGWNPAVLENALLSRSHRSEEGKQRLQKLINETRDILSIPDSHLIAIVAGSGTGAMELILWNILGTRGVDLLSWEVFGKVWCRDTVQHLQLQDVRVFESDFGDFPDLSQVSMDRDIVFCWNGTTSGVAVPNGDWISDDRTGLTLCDATSAAFAMDLPWDKLDATSFSWQKALGGEAQHGMIVLGPRAIERILSYTPPWPLPKVFRVTYDMEKSQTKRLKESLFRGETNNTPSMLCVEDFLDSLAWAKSMGGFPVLKQRTQDNFDLIESWVEKTTWIDFLAKDPSTRSASSVCLKLTEDWFTRLDHTEQWQKLRDMTNLLTDEKVAYDIRNHINAVPGFRIWAGPTIELNNIKTLLPWLEWAHEKVRHLSV